MGSKYVVAFAGDLPRDEHMNVAVFAWEHPAHAGTPVLAVETRGWGRIEQAFWPKHGLEMRTAIIGFLSTIKTVHDYETRRARLGPYSPYNFTEERASTDTPENTLRTMSAHFLGE